MSLLKASCNGVPNVWPHGCIGTIVHFVRGGGTHHLSWDAAVLRVLFTPEVHEVKLYPKNSGASGLKVFRLVRVALNLCNVLHRKVLRSPAEVYEAFRERHPHHVLQRDVNVIAFRAQQLRRRRQNRNYGDGYAR